MFGSTLQSLAPGGLPKMVEHAPRRPNNWRVTLDLQQPPAAFFANLGRMTLTREHKVLETA
jgi:hypothetical protein